MSQMKESGGRYGSHSGACKYHVGEFDDLWVANQKLQAANTPGLGYYVDRNINSSGDGLSWAKAFKTFKEAITQVNADYTNAGVISNGRNRVIFVAEGWYSETPTTLTASDVHIIGVAPGTHNSVVIYGSATAGGWNSPAGGPALTITGNNCTIANLGFFTHDTSYASLQLGAYHVFVYGQKIVNCNFVRDVFHGSKYGISTQGAENPLIENCDFSTSCLTAGIEIKSNGVNVPVNVRINNCRFIGTETGIIITSGHQTMVTNNWFIDDTTDRADTITVPCTNAGGGASSMFTGNYWKFSEANAVTGGSNPLMIDNFQLAAT